MHPSDPDTTLSSTNRHAHSIAMEVEQLKEMEMRTPWHSGSTACLSVAGNSSSMPGRGAIVAKEQSPHAGSVPALALPPVEANLMAK